LFIRYVLCVGSMLSGEFQAILTSIPLHLTNVGKKTSSGNINVNLMLLKTLKLWAYDEFVGSEGVQFR